MQINRRGEMGKKKGDRAGRQQEMGGSGGSRGFRSERKAAVSETLQEARTCIFRDFTINIGSGGGWRETTALPTAVFSSRLFCCWFFSSQLSMQGRRQAGGTWPQHFVPAFVHSRVPHQQPADPGPGSPQARRFSCTVLSKCLHFKRHSSLSTGQRSNRWLI